VRARFDLMVVTDPAIEGWRDALEAALGAAGARLAVQVRTHGGSGELRALAEDLRGMTAACGAPLLVNHRVEVAAAADGVHLKERGMEVGAARARLGAGALVGASCHDAAGLARRREADYVVLGPFAAVPGKGAPLGAERFGALVRDAQVPVLALGSVDARNAGEAIRAGAAGVAVSRAILASRDPASETRRILEAIDDARAERPLRKA